MEIASRILSLRDGDGIVDIPICIFAPTEKSPRAFACKYEIAWPDGTRIMEVWGSDSAQAMFLALQSIGAELYASSYQKAGTLFHGSPGAGYGFPVPATLRDL